MIQYNASLAITDAIRGTLQEKLYQELGFQSLQQRWWFRKLCTFYKIYKNQSLHYLYNLIRLQTSLCITRSSNNVPCFYFKHNFFKNYFFPICNYLMEQSRYIYTQFKESKHFLKKYFAVYKTLLQ